MEEMRTCRRPGCEEPLRRKEQETSQNFKRRRYCCKRCAATHRARKKKGKPFTGANVAFSFHMTQE